MWDLFILNPMINALLLLYDLLGTNFFLAIAVFTLLIRLLTLPLNMRQQRASMRMQEMQPQVQKIQKKYKDNPQKMQEEFQRIGYNPAESLLGCLPLLIQFPILIGLYRAIIVVLGSTPQALFELTQRAYDFIDLTALLPINNQFYWLNLAQPDPIFVLPLLVFGTTFLQQKLLTPQTESADNDGKKGKKEDDNPMAGMTKSMQYTMPLMFGFFALQFPAGLSLYFVLSNVIGVGQGLLMRRSMEEEKAAAAAKSGNGETPGQVDNDDVVAGDDGAAQDSKSRKGKKKKKSRAKGKRR
ncbi:MAG TPA: YidC/Oxa1 family membrane protein insertase [Candidatus Sulfomarinibacteraceae bacterium]|nr:YidC/Oxa1 family membrane protein insertase [Candidatus Sulfomarinibacteraceae bacterium]